MTLDILNWGFRTGAVISILIGLVLLVRRPFARFLGADAVFLLWSLPLIRLFLPKVLLPVKTDINLLPADIIAVPGFMDYSFGFPSAPSNGAVDIAQQSVERSVDLISITVFIWVSAAVLWLSYHFFRHIKYWRLLHQVSSPVEASLDPVIDKAVSIIGLKRRPLIRIAPKTIGPLVSGITKPLVILPQNFEEHFSKDAQLYALCHEFSHIKRRDVWAAFALLFFRAVHWYNPLVHYAARTFKIDQEAACDSYLLSRLNADEAAVQGYARALLLIEKSNAASPRSNDQMPALSLAMNSIIGKSSHETS